MNPTAAAQWKKAHSRAWHKAKKEFLKTNTGTKGKAANQLALKRHLKEAVDAARAAFLIEFGDT